MRILIVARQELADGFTAGAREMADAFTAPLERAGFDTFVCAVATSLDAAEAEIPRADGVICYQSIPTHSGRAAEPAETQTGNWAAVANRCQALAIPFLLVAARGGYRLAERFREVHGKTLSEWPALAIVEPVAWSFLASEIAGLVKASLRYLQGYAGLGAADAREVASRGRN
jgi:hypothetical protein